MSESSQGKTIRVVHAGLSNREYACHNMSNTWYSNVGTLVDKQLTLSGLEITQFPPRLTCIAETALRVGVMCK